MSGLFALVAGLVLLRLVWSERGNIKRDWKSPARFWIFRSGEAFRSRSPSQPFNVVLGTVLGACAVVYGVITLVT
jgi:hypothetical protein